MYYLHVLLELSVFLIYSAGMEAIQLDGDILYGLLKKVTILTLLFYMTCINSLTVL
jgi:hypothetical protein